MNNQPDTPRAQWRNQWAISIYTGESPLQLKPVAEYGSGPALTGRQVTDIRCHSVADPFLLQREGRWHLFFEAMNTDSGKGEIAHAISQSGVQWEYGKIVLREPFHLSYPFVFTHGSETYMVPETRQADSVRLYVAEQFPLRWRFLATLLRGRFADATLLRHEERWWLFAQRGLDEMRLYSSPDLLTGWAEHPGSPLWPGNRRRTRPGGRMVRYDNRLLRLTQDGLPSYGSSLRVYEVDRLNTTEYQEHEVPESPVLSATGTGWNAVGMHHMDAVELQPRHWLAAVDGASLNLC